MGVDKHIKELIQREKLTAYGQIVLGCILGGLAYPLFLVPNNIAPGGLTGVATILNYLFGLPVGVTSLVLNLPLFVIGYRSMGRVFAFRSLIATILFSLAIDAIKVPAMSEDVLLGSIYGGILLGLGLGLILRGGATTGGSDMIARMVHKAAPFVSVGMFLFFVDFLVIVGAGIFLGMQQALYALICIFVSSKAVDMVMVGLNTAKACYVITDQYQAVSSRVLSEMERGVTLLTAKGGFSGREKPVVLCVLTSAELAQLKNIVQQEDMNAFMFVTQAHEAMGEGFSKLGGEN